jgi:hypothetical protein
VSARHALRLAAVAACALSLLGMKDERFRYERSVDCQPGFCAVELPDDVIAAARPGLPDLRLLGERGEIAFALEEQLFAPPDAVAFIDVGSVPGQETTGVIDRGESSALIDAVRITLEGEEPYLKPVVLEDSADRVAFRRIAQASIFRTAGATMTELRFAPNDRRYLRVRLDDRASEARRPVSAVLHPVAPAPLSERAIPVTLDPVPSGDDSIDRFTLELPHPNLTSVALELDVPDPVFTRRVRVFEKLVFRDRVSRRLAGEGTIARYVGRPAELRVPLSALAGTSLEVEVERAGTPLGVRRGTIHVRPKRLVFRTPDSGAVTLLYGSPDAPPPSSDLASALSGGLPKQLLTGRLGPASDRGERSRLPEPLRGPRVDVSTFRNARPITLPPSGSLAYLDLVGVPKGAASFVRIVDAEGRQVPFVLESEERRATLPLHFSTEHEDGKTRLRVTGFSTSEPIEALELRASAPAFFRRPVDVYELRARACSSDRRCGRSARKRRMRRSACPSDRRPKTSCSSSSTTATTRRYHSRELLARSRAPASISCSGPVNGCACSPTRWRAPLHDTICRCWRTPCCASRRSPRVFRRSPRPPRRPPAGPSRSAALGSGWCSPARSCW